MILLQSGLRVKDDGAFCRRGVNSSRITWLKGLLICKQGIRCEWVTLCSLGTVIKPLPNSDAFSDDFERVARENRARVFARAIFARRRA